MATKKRGKRAAAGKKAPKSSRRAAGKTVKRAAGTRTAGSKAAKRAISKGAHCSFCGKPEKEVARLLAGGGEQPAGMLPVVNICNECIALCNRILLDHPSKRHTPWTLFVTGGQQYEWAAFAQDDGSTFMMVRRFNNDQKSFGLVLERGDQPSTDLAKETVVKVPEYF